MACLKIPFFAFLITAIVGVLGLSFFTVNKTEQVTEEAVQVSDTPPLTQTGRFSQNGVTITLQYPEGWSFEATETLMFLANSPEAIEAIQTSDTFTIGAEQLGIVIQPFPVYLLGTAEVVFDMMLEEFRASSTENELTSIGDAEPFIAGSYSGQKAFLDSEDADGYFYAVGTGEDIVIVIVTASPNGAADGLDRVVRQVVATITVTSDE
jgi:hypothetical protein